MTSQPEPENTETIPTPQNQAFSELGEYVLDLLHTSDEWDSETLDFIAEKCVSLSLAGQGEDGFFERKPWKHSYKLIISPDSFPENPRKCWDHLAKFAFFHSREHLGDKGTPTTTDEMEDFLEEEGKDNFYLFPIYLYDHGQITISLSPFSCRWDSGQVGWAYIEKKVVAENAPSFSATITERLQLALEIVESEIKEYDCYLRGDIWGYIIKDETGKDVESCWGIYSEDDALSEGQEALKSLQENQS